MTFYFCLGLTGISFNMSYDYIRFSCLFFTIAAVSYHAEHVMGTMHLSQQVLIAKTVVLESLIKEKLPEDYKKIYTENIFEPIKID